MFKDIQAYIAIKCQITSNIVAQLYLLKLLIVNRVARQNLIIFDYLAVLVWCLLRQIIFNGIYVHGYL